MQSPPAEWAILTGGMVATWAGVDLMRAHGEADGDTASEVVRDLVDRTPAGVLLFDAALILGGLAFRRHIVKPLTSGRGE